MNYIKLYNIFIEEKNQIKYYSLKKEVDYNINKKHRNLYNCGNTCYLSSLFQMLSYIPEFVEELKNKKEYSYISEIFENLYKNENTKYNPTINIEKMKKILPDPDWKFNEQNDPSDFFYVLFEQVVELSMNYFKFLEIDEKECIYDTKDNFIIKETPNYILNLEFDKPVEKSISALIASQGDFVVSEKGNEVENCDDGKGGSRGPFKRKYIYKINNYNKYILIYLKRGRIFIDKYGNPQVKKLQDKIKINHEINFANNNYQLYGSILHIGSSLKSGHYTFVRVINKNNGYLYDDVRDDVIDYNLLDNKADFESQSYLLIYKRLNL